MMNVTAGGVHTYTDTLEKANKGVTLIALVVTITILLILAGISIAALTGENGLIKRAGNAKEQTEIAQEKEILQQATVSAMGKSKSGDVEKDKLDIELSKFSEIDTSKTKEVTDGIEVTFKSGRTYTVNFDGDVIQKTPRIYSDEVKAALTEGKYVTYNGKTYRVLYDVNSGYDWIEIVSVNPLESVTLGYRDPEIPLNTELENQGYGTTYAEKARWSYNNAIITLHKKAQNYLTDLADRARCVGSNPIQPDADTVEYGWNNKLKIDDTNHLRNNENEVRKDYDQLSYLNMVKFKDKTYGDRVWLATRRTYQYNDGTIIFVVRRVDYNGFLEEEIWLCNRQSSGNIGYNSGFNGTSGFRPVIRLKDSIKITGGAGTEGSPYTIGL